VYEESKCQREDVDLNAKLRSGASIKVPDHWECSSKKRLVYRVHVPALPGMFTMTTHRPCAHNEWHGLVNRVLMPTPTPTKAGIEELDLQAKILSRRLIGRFGPFQPWATRQVCDNYSGAKRTRYLNAEESLIREGPASELDARLSTFVKADKLRFEGGRKDPRIIQARGVRYNLELACYLKPLEHALYNLRGDRVKSGHGRRVIVKGLNQRERASLISEKLDSIPNCTVLGLDMRRFDAHVSVEQLRIEHKVYNTMLRDPRFAKLLSWQLKNKGRTSNGIRYSVTGGRMSGDMNTALGNCILMYLMCCAVAKRLSLKNWDVNIDGDDTLFFLPNEHVARFLEEAPGLFLEFGHVVKIESIARELEAVLHCQSRPVKAAKGYQMVRNPWKVMSNALSAVRHFHEPRGGMRVMKSIAMCELALNQGVPVLQPYAVRLLELLKGYTFARLPQESTLVRRAVLEAGSKWTEVKEAPISFSSRLSFEMAWGWPVEAQIEAEKSFAEMTLADLDLSRMAHSGVVEDDWRDPNLDVGRAWEPFNPWDSHPS